VAYRNSTEFMASVKQVVRSREVRGTLQAILSLEMAQRGYILTDETSFLEPYQRAADTIQVRLAHAKSLTAHERDLRRMQVDSNRTRGIAQSTITVAEAGSVLAVVIILAMGIVYRWGLTARRRAEQALQESLAKETLIMRALPIVIYSAKASEDFATNWISHSIEKMSGFPSTSFLTDPGLWASRLHPDDRDRVFQEFQRLPETGTLNIEYRWQVADGTYHWFFDQAVLQTLPDGSPKEVLGLWLDITDRKAVDEQLREVHDRLTALVQASPVGIVSLDAEGLCRLWNPAAEKIFGWPESEVLGRPLPTVGPEQIDEHRLLRERVMKDKAFTDLEVARYRKDGTPVYISLSTAPLRDPSGSINGLLGLMVDMTQRKQVELQLSQSRDQLRALTTRLHSAREEEGTRIAREVHDELGQAMTGLKLDLSWVARRLSLPETADSRAQMLERIQGTMQQLDRTIQAVRAIATALRPSVLDELGLAAALDWQTRDFEKRTGICCEWSMPAAPIPIGPDQATAMFRIYQEILTNVVRHAQASTLLVHLEVSAGWLVLRVADNGRGIPASTLANNNSLGLLGMRERATQWGGDLSIQASDGKGTTVTVRLPVLGGVA
jgi:PAS domain S-box-containing protein